MFVTLLHTLPFTTGCAAKGDELQAFFKSVETLTSTKPRSPGGRPHLGVVAGADQDAHAAPGGARGRQARELGAQRIQRLGHVQAMQVHDRRAAPACACVRAEINSTAKRQGAGRSAAGRLAPRWAAGA